MSGNGSRKRSKEYGTKGPLLPTPRPCSGLRSSGINQTEMMMSLERQDSISSPQDTHVSPSLSPGSVWARKMTGISGRTLRRWLPTSSLAGVFSRMCMDTSRWGSTRCYLTWKRSATPAGRSLFRLVPSAPPTGGIASGFWPTPDVGMTQGGRAIPEGTTETGKTPDGRKVQVGLTNAVRMFPTPRHEGFDAGSHRGKPDSLHAAVKLMPTPTARDWKDGSSVQNVPENGLLGRWSVNHSTTPGPGQKLSAAWTARLMGYPDGHLDLDEEWIEIA